MMTKKQIEMLKLSIDGIRLDNITDTESRAALEYLRSNGFCFTKPYSEPIYRATQKGKSELDRIEKEAEQNAKEERQRRFDNKISVLNVLIPLVSFIGGVLIEHYTRVIELITSFFG